MTKSERWLTSVAVLASVLPLIFIAFIIKLLPLEITLERVPLFNEEAYLNKYTYLVTGLFCIVPLSIVLISVYIKRRMVVFRNYKAILIMVIVLSLSFTAIATQGVFIKIESLKVFNEFDIIGFFSVVLSIGMALSGNLTRYKNSKSVLAIRNKYTKASSSVFKTVHHNAAAVQTWTFILVSVAVSFTSGWISLTVFGAAAAAYLIWCYLYSRAVLKYFERKKREYKKAHWEEFLKLEMMQRTENMYQTETHGDKVYQTETRAEKFTDESIAIAE